MTSIRIINKIFLLIILIDRNVIFYFKENQLSIL